MNAGLWRDKDILSYEKQAPQCSCKSESNKIKHGERYLYKLVLRDFLASNKVIYYDGYKIYKTKPESERGPFDLRQFWRKWLSLLAGIL